MLIFALLLAQATVRVEQNSAAKGYASTLNYTGAGFSCSVSGRKATCNVPGGGGGGGSPGGSSGNVQINSAGSVRGVHRHDLRLRSEVPRRERGGDLHRCAERFPTPAGYRVGAADPGERDGVRRLHGHGSLRGGLVHDGAGRFRGEDVRRRTRRSGHAEHPADVSGASYWTRVAEPGLSNETALGALGTGIVLNTADDRGVPTIYGGTSCTNQFPRSLNASGAATCAGVALTDLTATGTPSATTFLRGDNTWATPAGGGGAPTTATYITQTPDATLSAEQALSTLATGLLKNTTTTGVLTIAAAGTDYQAPPDASALDRERRHEQQRHGDGRRRRVRDRHGARLLGGRHGRTGAHLRRRGRSDLGQRLRDARHGYGRNDHRRPGDVDLLPTCSPRRLDSTAHRCSPLDSAPEGPNLLIRAPLDIRISVGTLSVIR
jgi:hypothetical protein